MIRVLCFIKGNRIVQGKPKTLDRTLDPAGWQIWPRAKSRSSAEQNQKA